MPLSRVPSSFTGTTSIASPSANTVAITTSSTERLRITSTGNVGIGTSSIGSARLTVDSGSGALIASFNSTNASGGYATWQTSGTTIADIGTAQSCFGAGGSDTFAINGRGARALLFGTNNTERMRITSAGRVGIGTSETGAELNVYGSNANTLSSSTFWTPNHEGIVLRNTSDVTNTVTGISFQSGSSGNSISGIGNISESLSLGALGFFTGGAGRSNTVPERMRIDSIGNVLVGQTTDELGTSNSLQVTSAGAEVSQFNKNTAADGVIMRFKKQGLTVGFVSTNTSSLPSDARVKTDIQDIGYGLEFVEALRPVQYNTVFQDQTRLSEKNFGLIAQEVEQALSAMGKSISDVTFLEKFETESDKESRYGLGYQNLVPVLIKAIQEQQTIINDLKDRIEALESN
jgi:trimeric autotransporter adhesin